MFLATNQERHRLQYLLGEMGLGTQVDGDFASCTVGVRKPDAGYFAEVTRRLQLPPAGIVCWDDAPANVAAARAAGWTAQLYQGVQEFREAVERLA